MIIYIIAIQKYFNYYYSIYNHYMKLVVYFFARFHDSSCLNLLCLIYLLLKKVINFNYLQDFNYFIEYFEDQKMKNILHFFVNYHLIKNLFFMNFTFFKFII
jgi:hypothetical protein